MTLNQPADRTVSELLPDREMGALSGVQVFIGGPVARDQLIFAAFEWNDEEERMECRHHIDVEEAEELVTSSSATVRAFVGYAGWTKGQLEQELAQKAWLLKRPEPRVIESAHCDSLWRDLLATFGPWFRIVGEAPEDPALN